MAIESGAVVLALDLGATQVRAAAITPEGERLARTSAPTPRGEGAQAIYAACAAALESVGGALSGELAGRIRAIGISSMGPVDPARGVVVDPPNLADLRDAPLAGEMSRRLGLPAVLDRDTNVAALAEHWLGAARGCRDFLYVTVSTGIGGAIWRDGGLMLGPDGSAGELGHFTLKLEAGPVCGCGGVGHLEAISSGSGLARQATEIVGGDPSSSPYLRALSGPITGRDVAEGEAAGDRVCVELMDQARRAFAIACAGWVNAFNPERIVVGGTVAEKQGDRWLDPARDEVAARAFRVPAARVKIVPAELGADVALVGAWPLVAERL